MHVLLISTRRLAVRLLLTLGLAGLAQSTTLPSAGQSLPYSVSSLGMGGAGPSSVRDHSAIFLNPANLVYDDRGGRVVMSFLPVRFAGGGNLVQFGFYNEGLGGGTITESRKHELIEQWFGASDRNAMRYVGASAAVVPFAMAVRGTNWGAGFAAQVRTHNRMGMNRGLLDLALFGLAEERSVPVDGEIEGMNTVHLSFAYSRRFPERRWAVGVAPKLILGTSYAHGKMNSVVDVHEDALVHRFDYTLRAAGSYSHDMLDRYELLGAADPAGNPLGNPFGSVAGKGAGIDLGTTYEMRPNVSIAASLTDLGFVSWNADAQRITPLHSEFRFEGLTLDLDRIEDEFEGSLGNYVTHVMDSLADDAYGTVDRKNVSFMTSTPAAVHAGGTLYFNEQLGALSVGTSVPLNGAAGNMTRRPSAYVGLEYRLGRRYGIPIRAGVRAGGMSAVSTAIGIGFHTPLWEFAVSAAATPSSEAVGGGMQLTAGISLLTLRFAR